MRRTGYRRLLAAKTRMRFETPPGRQFQIDFGERRVPGAWEQNGMSETDPCNGSVSSGPTATTLEAELRPLVACVAERETLDG